MSLCKTALIKSLIYSFLDFYIYLFGGLHRFRHSTGYIRTSSFMGRGNQYIQIVKVLNCKLLTIRKQLPTLLPRVWGLNRQPQSWEVNVLPLHHHVSLFLVEVLSSYLWLHFTQSHITIGFHVSQNHAEIFSISISKSTQFSGLYMH